MIIIFLKVISLHAVKDLDELQNFFTELVKVCLDADSPGARLDFLACPLTQSNDALEIVEILEGLTQVSYIAHTIMDSLQQLTCIKSQSWAGLSIKWGMTVVLNKFY